MNRKRSTTLGAVMAGLALLTSFAGAAEEQKPYRRQLGVVAEDAGAGVV